MKKIKYGAHCFLWISKWESSHVSLFETSKELGLDSFEIAVGNDIDFDTKLIRRKSEELGIEIIISPGADWPMAADISLQTDDANKYSLDWHKYWIDRGSEAGATAYTGALYGHPGRIEKVAPSKEEFNRIVDGLNQLAEYASGKGVKLVLEPMSHFRTHVANTPVQVMNLINSADHSNLFVLLDTYHLVTELREYETGIKLMGDKIWGVHACENDRGVPGGGLVPWDSIFATLKEVGFEGYMILETYNSTIENGDFAYARGMFHNVCPDGNEFVKTGTKFLKSKW